ncbi:MAG: glycosyltransferase [Bauldia sp.]|nr:glycosyltransferase [Bauldia sp.]
MRATTKKHQPSSRTLATLIDLAWCSRRLGRQPLATAEVLTRLKSGTPARFRSDINPLIDLEFIANTYLGGGEGLSAFDVLARYVRDLMPRGLSPHPLIDQRVYEFCRARKTGRHRILRRQAWVKAMLKEPDPSGQDIVPFLDPAFILKQARLKPIDLARLGASSVSRYYLAVGARKGLLPHPLFDPLFVHAHRTGRFPAPADLADPGAFLVTELAAYISQGGRQRRASPSLGFDEAFVRKNRTVAKAVRMGRYANAFHAYVAHKDQMGGLPLTPTGIDAFPTVTMPKAWWQSDDALPKRQRRIEDPNAFFLAAARKRLAAETVLPARVHVDGDLPHAVLVGQRLAIVIHGYALSPCARLRQVDIRVGRRMATGSFQGFPRPDIGTSAGTIIKSADRMLCGFALAWCGTAEMAGPIAVAVRFRSRKSRTARKTGWYEAGAIAVDTPTVRIHSGSPARVAIAMATFEPKTALFHAQIESIRSQTMADWRLVISDESESAAGRHTVDAEAARDLRISVIRGPRLGFVGNFERALGQLDRRSPFFALSDQDDVWYPEKIERLIEAIEREHAALAYGGMRITSETGAVIDESFFSWRQRHGDTTDELLVINTVTGAACLGRMSLMPGILPIPRYRGVFHDMWIALVSSRLGGISCVEGPLQDYIQHGGNVYGQNSRKDKQVARTLSRQARLIEAALSHGTPELHGSETDANRSPEEKLLQLLSSQSEELVQRGFLDFALKARLMEKVPPHPLDRSTLAQMARTCGRKLKKAGERTSLNLPRWLEVGARYLLERLSRTGRRWY